MENRAGAPSTVVVVLVVLVPAAVSLSFVEPFRGYAALLWTGGLVLTAAALVLILRRATHRAGHRADGVGGGP